jgi:hypothetical protein
VNSGDAPPVCHAIRKTGEDEPIAMNIGADEQHRAADRVESHEIRATAQILHMHPPMIPPCVQIEGRPAVTLDAMGVDDVAPSCDEKLDQIPRIIDHIDVEPQDPILLLERSKQQMVSRLRQDLSPGDLESVGPAGKSLGDAEIEVLLPDLGAAVAAGQMPETFPDPLERPVIAIAFEEAERGR